MSLEKKNNFLAAIVFLTYPRDPSVLKLLRRVNFGTGSKFGTEVAKRCLEGSEMLVFLGQKRQESSTICHCSALHSEGDICPAVGVLIQVVKLKAETRSREKNTAKHLRQATTRDMHSQRSPPY